MKLCYPHPLSGNMLKVIAAVSMLADHMGLLLFPGIRLFRIIGRLAFPIFAFMIAEGCRYTKSRLRHFTVILGFAVIFQVVYFVFDRSLYMSIFVTFSISILIIYALQEVKSSIASKGKKYAFPLSVALFCITVAAAWLLNYVFTIDYGFWGCMTPVFASLFMGIDKAEDIRCRLDRTYIHVLTMTVPLAVLSLTGGPSQPYCLITVPLLLAYSGKRGKRKMKYFFYIFYPAHLILLQAIDMML